MACVGVNCACNCSAVTSLKRSFTDLSAAGLPRPTHHPVPESGKWLVVYQYKRLIPCMTNVLDVHSHTFPFAQYVITVNLVFSILVRKNQEPTDIALSHSR